MTEFAVKKGLLGKYTVVMKCPGCKSELKADEDDAGMDTDCPHCGRSFTVPGGAYLEALRAREEQSREAREAEREQKRDRDKAAQESGRAVRKQMSALAKQKRRAWRGRPGAGASGAAGLVFAFAILCTLASVVLLIVLPWVGVAVLIFAGTMFVCAAIHDLRHDLSQTAMLLEERLPAPGPPAPATPARAPNSKRKQHAEPVDECSECGYPLCGLEASGGRVRCPECGAAMSAPGVSP